MTKEIETNSFSCWYDEKEDRIRLVANLNNSGERADFWITRRSLLSLIVELESYLEHVGLHTEEEKSPSPPISSPKSEAIKKHTAPRDLKSSGKREHQLPDPEILENLRLRYLTQHQRIHISLHSTSYIVHAFPSPVQLRQFLHMLIQHAPSAEWGLGLHLHSA